MTWFRIHDTCGVNNLHGVPAILSALFSIFYAWLANVDNYKDSLDDIFPAMTPKNSTLETTKIVGVRTLQVLSVNKPKKKSRIWSKSSFRLVFIYSLANQSKSLD